VAKSERRAVVVVEGVSDRVAIETLARRRGRDLAREGVSVLPMGGAHAIGRFLNDFAHLAVAGLCDAGEEEDFRRALEGAGFGSDLTRADMEELGFYVCVKDLEDELIRALGPRRVEELIEAEGEHGPFLTFTRQPAHRGQVRDQQLRRFMGTRSGRKIRYGHVLAAALDPTRVPGPLAGLLSAV
jgi:hypothetical protein